jgi:hypothetical protein
MVLRATADSMLVFRFVTVAVASKLLSSSCGCDSLLGILSHAAAAAAAAGMLRSTTCLTSAESWEWTSPRW